MGQPGCVGQTPAQITAHFLHLLSDVSRTQGLYLSEIDALKVRVRELEASGSSGATGNAASRSETFLPRVPDCAVYSLSAEGSIQTWSGGACELYGYSAEEALGRSCRMLQPESVAAVLGSASVVKPMSSLNLRRRKDGGVFVVFLHQAPLRAPDGQLCGWMHLEILAGRRKGDAFGARGGAL